MFGFFQTPTQTQQIIERITTGAATAMSDLDIVQAEIREWLMSPQRELMLLGDMYYRNHTEIDKKRRLLSDGVTELENRNNAKLEYGFYRKIVDQRIGYLLSRAPSIETKNEQYSGLLTQLFNKEYWRNFRILGRDALNKGIAWLQPYIAVDGLLKFQLIPSEEVIPLWKDASHTELDALIRVYQVCAYEGKEKVLITKVEIWTIDGAQFLSDSYGKLYPDIDALGIDTDGNRGHFLLNGQAHNWTRIPFVPLRCNDIEQPFIDTIKSLIDDYNMQASVNADALADISKAIMKLINFGGENLDEFLRDLQQYGVIKLFDGGNVDYIQTEPQTENTMAWLEGQRRHIYEFGGGMDSQNEDVGNASGVALDFRYHNIDTVSNIFENEIQMSFENILWFVNEYYKMTGQGDYSAEDVSIVFNRDRLQDEAAIINNCKASAGIVSKRTITANHPWVDDLDSEMDALEEEAQAAQDEFLFQTQAKIGAITGTDNVEK